MRTRAARRRAPRRAALLAAVAAAPLAWLCTSPAGAATDTPSASATSTVTIPDRAEAWYAASPVDVCTTPLGCPPPQVPTSPYPADTLHVGVAGGQETARSYLVPDLSALPAGSTAVSGAMTIPVSTGTTDGTASAGSAKLLACLAKAPVTDGVAGSSSKPPAIDCNTAVGLDYDGTHGVFRLDLTPFLAAWAHGAAQDGIALIPSHTTQQTDVWHVAINGRKRASTPHVSATVAVTVADAGAALPSAPIPAAPPAAAPAPAPVSLPQPPASLGVPAAPPVIASSSAPAAVPIQPVALSRAFQYPLAFLLPIVLLAAAVFLARLFTRDATPRRLRA